MKVWILFYWPADCECTARTFTSYERAKRALDEHVTSVVKKVGRSRTKVHITEDYGECRYWCDSTLGGQVEIVDSWNIFESEVES